MSVGLIDISDKAIQGAVIRVLNELNETTLQVDLDTLEFVPGSDSYLTLLEGGVRAGVLIGKVNISELFVSNLDLGPFKQRSLIKQQVRSEYELNEAQTLVSDFNNSRDIPLLQLAPDGYDVPEGIAEDVAKDFLLFCRVFGFWELNFQNTILNKQDGILHISVVETHPVYTGSLEVLV